MHVVVEETRAMLRVNSPRKHPNVLAVDYVCSPVSNTDEMLFLEELIEGDSLQALIDSRKLYEVRDGEDKKIVLQQRIGSMVVQLFSALAHVHACGVLHQDVKPDNIMVDTSSWRVFLIDFGAAMIAEPADCGGDGTVRAPMKGSTPVFASPLQRRLHAKLRAVRDPKKKRELLRSRLLSQVDDMWSAVATCLEMLGGGSAWREYGPSDAWDTAGRTLSGLSAGLMQVALLPELAHVFKTLPHSAYGAHSTTTAQQVADSAARVRCCSAKGR